MALSPRIEVRRAPARRLGHQEHVLVEERQRVGRSEGHLSGGELVEHDAARVHVAPAVERLVAALLRRHVVGRSDHPARVTAAAVRERDAEVADLHDLAGTTVVVLVLHEHDVVGFHVTVDDAAQVRVREARAHLHHDVHDARQGEEVRNICFQSQIRNWRELDNRSVIVEAGSRDEYKLELIGTCQPRDAFTQIGLVSRGGGSCLSTGDTLITDSRYNDGSCSIRRIYKWNKDAKPADGAAATAN